MAEDSGTTEATDTGTNDADGSGEGGSPYAEQFASIENRIGQVIDSKLSEHFPQEEPAGFTDQLYAPYEDGNFEDVPDDELDGYDDFDPNELSPEEYVQQLIAEQIAPLQQELSARQEAEYTRQIDALTERYPDLQNDPEIQGAVLDQIENLVGIYGEGAKTPQMVELVYKAVKADVLAANEVPAESVAQGQAHIETGAGPSQQGEVEPDDEIRKAIMSHSVGGDPF